MNHVHPAPFAYEGLERIFHERGRLAVCTCLVANPAGMSFTALQEACALTDGNLNRHLHALAETKIVTLEDLSADVSADATTEVEAGRASDG